VRKLPKMTHESITAAASARICCVSSRSVMDMLVSAAIAGTAVAVASETSDPIFAVIEEHKKPTRDCPWHL
jgi:hypothetical protein